MDKEDEGFDGEMLGQPGVKELVQQALDEGVDPSRIVVRGLTEAMKIVGEKFEAKEYFIPDMLASAETVGEAMDILAPYLARSGVASRGKVLMATVKGDLHDIGKNIVTIILKGAGYEVKDLGADVGPEQIVASVREEKPDLLGLSALLTTTMVAMRETIDSLSQAGLRDGVKVIIGGAPTSAEFATEIGADGYGVDAFHAVRVVEELLQAS
ncbi:MAG: cobalamin-binding protein [Anaerolineales bacterium]|nr:MAG: cobalamin-binding protein [Anaerolineales bacterium]